MTRYAVLLRGINVGASTKVPMPRLRELAEGLGWTDVSTYINSGNLFAECGTTSQAGVEEALAQALLDGLARPVDVVARTRPFLTGTPSAAGVVAFDAELERHPERGVVIGTEAYIDFVAGAGRTKLGWDKVVRAMGVKGTARNWRTVHTLLEKV